MVAVLAIFAAVIATTIGLGLHAGQKMDGYLVTIRHIDIDQLNVANEINNEQSFVRARIAGMLEMRQAGAWNVAQDEASCVVFGMPREAIAAGATHETGPLKELPGMVLGHLMRHGGRALRV
jgi:hypothetical protein